MKFTEYKQKRIIEYYKKQYVLPFTNQVMFGAGAPCALHEIVASFPSKAVKF